MLLRNDICYLMQSMNKADYLTKQISTEEISLHTDFVVLHRNTTNKEQGVSETKLSLQCDI